MSEADGKTGDTTRGLISFLNVHRLPICMYEQSPEMLVDKNTKEYEWFKNTLMEVGFCTNAKIFNSNNFRSPTSRRRTYGVIVEYMDMGITPRAAASMCDDVLNFVLSMKDGDGSKISPLSSYLERNTSDILKQELANLQETKQKDLEKDISETGWRADISKACVKYRIAPSQVVAPEDISSSKWSRSQTDMKV